MNRLYAVAMVISLFGMASDSMASAAFDFRSFVTSIPQKMDFKHHRLDGIDLIQLDFQMDQPLDASPSEVSVSMGSGTLTTYYDRFYLKQGSVLTINGVARPLTCLWIKAQTMNSDPNSMIINQFYLVADAADCTGPILPNGKDRWETFLKILRWPYFQSRSNDVFLTLYGNQYKLRHE